MINTRQHFLKYFFNIGNISKGDIAIFELSGINLLVDDFLDDLIN